MFDLSGDIGDSLLQTCELGSKAAASVVSREIILRLMFRAIEIIADILQLFESDIDGAVLAAGQKQRALPFL